MEKDVRITFRAPMNLRNLVREFINLGPYMNESDFYRHAAIEKIQRDAPELYRKLVNRTIKEVIERKKPEAEEEAG